jgi:hypothetical protein
MTLAERYATCWPKPKPADLTRRAGRRDRPLPLDATRRREHGSKPHARWEERGALVNNESYVEVKVGNWEVVVSSWLSRASGGTGRPR